jgi:Niemann-Pick C1 protein
MLCGMDASECSPAKWYDYLGNPKKNNLVPFPIHYVITETNTTLNGTEYTPMDIPIYPCNESCSCQDCSAVCQPIPPYIPPVPRTILGIPYMYFIMGCCLVVFLILFGIYNIYLCLYGKEFQQPESSGVHINGDPTDAEIITPKDVTCFEKIGVWVESTLEKGFNHWGFLCAKHPIIVIVGSLIFCGILSAGISKFTVITDPVELWSSPDSRARQEKNYFDENFNPFYRTEMLIITATDNSQWMRHDSGESEDSHLYGPVLRKSILSQVELLKYSSGASLSMSYLPQVLELQLNLEAITAFSEKLNQTVSLEDICFAPLSPDNRNCTIQSVLNYFQNSQENLDATVGEFFIDADYIDHFSSCAKYVPIGALLHLLLLAFFRDPLSIADTSELHSSCLGTFGGPIMPWVALGGFPGRRS